MEVQDAQTGALRAGPDEAKVNRIVEAGNNYKQLLDTHTMPPACSDRSLNVVFTRQDGIGRPERQLPLTY